MATQKNDVQQALDLAARAGQLEASGYPEAVETAQTVRALLRMDAETQPFLKSTFENCEHLLTEADQLAQAHDQGTVKCPGHTDNPTGRTGETDPRFWDCECENDYIHKKSKTTTCDRCGSDADSGPDSMVNELIKFVPGYVRP